MKKKEIIRQLSDEFDRIAPKMSEKVKREPIASEVTLAQPEAVTAGVGRGGFFTAKRSVALGIAGIFVIAAIVLLALLVPSGGKYTFNDSYISMKLAMPVIAPASYSASVTTNTTQSDGTQNVSLFIVADSDGNVRKIAANDREGEILLAGISAAYAAQGESLIGRKESVVVDMLTETSKYLGYMGTGGVLAITSISARGEDASQRLADELGETARRAAGSGVSVTSKVAAKETLQAELGVTGEYELSALLEIAYGKGGYLQENAEKMFSQGGSSQAYNSYLFELFEEYFELQEDRFEALEELDEIYEEIRGKTEVLPILTDGKLNVAIDVSEKLKKEFEEALAECAETGFVPESDAEFTAWYAFYSILERQSEWIEDLIEEHGDKFAEFAQTVDKIFRRLENTLNDFLDNIRVLREEWERWKGDVDESGFSDPEDYIEKMTEAFEREYHRLRYGTKA